MSIKKATVWKDIKGQEYSIEEIDNNYLLNIIRLIEKKSKQGVEIIKGSYGSTSEEMWADSDFIEGDEVLEYFNYSIFVKEALKRKII